jgi:hypothetical protein
MKTTFLKLCLVAVTAIFTGCSTFHAKWDARIGSYTFDQAVMDYGPPARQTRLSDSKVVAEWVSHTSYSGTMTTTGGYYRPYSRGPRHTHYYYTPGYINYTGPSTYEDVLRLTFTTNNILFAWSEH